MLECGHCIEKAICSADIQYKGERDIIGNWCYHNALGDGLVHSLTAHGWRLPAGEGEREREAVTTPRVDVVYCTRTPTPPHTE